MPAPVSSPAVAAPLIDMAHAPVGAWTSLTFGAPGRGLTLQQETLDQTPNADLLVAPANSVPPPAEPRIRLGVCNNAFTTSHLR